MELALLLARLLLAAVFLLAGVSKIGDAKGAIQTFRDFGIPKPLAAPLSVLLMMGEICVAIALIPIAFAWYGACGALALFLIFLLAIGIVMARGRNPECNCFGKLHSSPIGWKTLARNGLLAALAGWLVLRGPLKDGPSLWGHLVAAGENERKLFIIAGCAMCFLLFRAVRGRPAAQTATAVENAEMSWDDFWGSDSDDEAPKTPDESTASHQPPAAGEAAPARNGAPKPPPPKPPPPKPAPIDPALQKILEAGTGLPIGTPAPEFTLPNLAAQKASLQSLRAEGKPVCLVFASPHCDPCRALLPHLSRWMRDPNQAFNFVLITRGAPSQNAPKLDGLEASRVLLQREFEISNIYGVRSTPAAVLIGPDGRIQSQLAVGREDIQRLIFSPGKPSSVKAESDR